MALVSALVEACNDAGERVAGWTTVGSTQLVALVMVMTCGCSLAVRGVPDGWTAKHEPECTDSIALPLLDGIISGTALGIGVEASLDDPKADVVGVSAAVALLAGISSAIGYSRVADCKRAKSTFQLGVAMNPRSTDNGSTTEVIGPADSPFWCSQRTGVCTGHQYLCEDGPCFGATSAYCAVYRVDGKRERGFLCASSRNKCLMLRDAREHRRGRYDFGECVEQKSVPLTTDEMRIVENRRRAEEARRAQAEASRQTAPISNPAASAPAAPVPPRGFYCSVSANQPTAGFCIREKAACIAARDAALAAVADLTACQLTETSWCFGSRCAPSPNACEEQRRKASSDEPASEIAGCQEEQ